MKKTAILILNFIILIICLLWFLWIFENNFWSLVDSIIQIIVSCIILIQIIILIIIINVLSN